MYDDDEWPPGGAAAAESFQSETLKPDLPPPQSSLCPPPSVLPHLPPPPPPGEARAARPGGVGNAQHFGPSCLRLPPRLLSLSVSAVGSPRSGVFFQPAGKRRIFGLTDGRTRRAARRGQTGSARLGSALPSSAAVEKPGRRPAVCAQPPAGLRPGLPLFSRKMDGFTGSLGKSHPPLAPERSTGHLSELRRDGELHAPLAALHVSLLYLSKTMHRPSGGCRDTNPTAPPEGDSPESGPPKIKTRIS